MAHRSGGLAALVVAVLLLCASPEAAGVAAAKTLLEHAQAARKEATRLNRRTVRPALHQVSPWGGRGGFSSQQFLCIAALSALDAGASGRPGRPPALRGCGGGGGSGAGGGGGVGGARPSPAAATAPHTAAHCRSRSC